MKVLSFTERPDGYVVVETDDPDFPTVAYPGDKFNNLNALKAEINKKKAELNRTRAREMVRRNRLRTEMQAEIDNG